MTQLVPELQAIIEASRGSLEPTANDLAGGRARLVAAMAMAGAASGAAASAASAAGAGAGATSVGAGASAASVSASASTTAAAVTTAGGAAVKLGAIVVGVGAVVGGGTVVVDRVASPSQHVARAAKPVEMPAPDRVETTRTAEVRAVPTVMAVASTEPATIAAQIKTSTQPSRRSVPVPIPSTVPVPVRVPVVVPVPAPVLSPVAVPSSLSVELSLLDGARRAIRAADPTTARALLVEHLRQFPHGQLAEERARIARSLPAAPASQRTMP